MLLQTRLKTLDLRRRIGVVAIINVTPDSYYAASRSAGVAAVLQRAEECLEQGADVLEIGGESTGPGSMDVSIVEEERRVLPCIEALRKKYPDVWLMVDTYKATIAARALETGADMVNDVTAGRGDPTMFSVVERAGCPYVLMYAKDPSPRTTVRPTKYPDIIKTITTFFQARMRAAKAAGVGIPQIVLDPGLGHFLSADRRYSYEVLLRLAELQNCGPLLVSPSRKSFLAGMEDIPPSGRLPATLAASAIAVLQGASFIRTHDVGVTRRVVDAALSLRKTSKKL
jgi:dihydropteroate synthase